jgi:DNA recombination protein RmuC
MIFFIALLAACGASCFTWFICRARQQTLSALCAQAKQENEKLSESLMAAQSAATEASRANARLEASVEAKDAQLAAQQGFIEAARADMEREFRLIAASSLDRNARNLGEQHEAKLGELLRPFREQIHHFQEAVGKHFVEEGKEKTALQKEIEILHRSSQLLSQQANGLAEALRGSTKQQGDWGESILEKILEFCGFQEGIHYTRQASAKSEDGNGFRPDVVLHLAGGRNLVIDSKVSLNAYWDMCACEDASKKNGFLPSITAALRRHIDELHRRPYQEVSGTPGYLIMFVPVEAAYVTALQHDGGLWQHGYAKGVLIISPTNLIPFLRMVESLWDREKKYENAEAIAKQAGALYDKLAGFVDTYQKLGSALAGAQKSYDESYAQLAGGRGNLLSKAEQMKALHISNKKQVPAAIAERAQLADGIALPEETASR